MEEHAAQPGPDPLDEAAVAARLEAIEAEARLLRASLSGAQATPKEVERTEEPVQLQTTPTPAEQAEIDRQLAFVMLSRKRGDKVSTEKALAELETKWPQWPTVLEMRGDLLLEGGKAKESLTYYKRAKELDPTNIAIERKYAELVLKQARATMPFDLALAENQESAANAKIATILSAVVPGLGQMVTGQIGKGVFFFVIWIAGWVWVFLTPGGLQGLLKAATGASSEFHAIILIPLFLAVGFHLISIFDAASRAKHAPKRKIDHPAPPANLPFE